jgi:hypothetical protein
MNRIDERLGEQSENAVASSPKAYESPRIIQLGKSKSLIRGAATDGYADNSHDFYTTGE